MNTCVKCGQPITSKAFCTSCGQSAGPASNSRIKPFLPFLVGALVVGAVTWSFASSGLLQVAGKESKTGGLSASAKPGAPSIIVPAAPAGSPSIAFGGSDAASDDLVVAADNPPGPSTDLSGEPEEPVTAQGTGVLPDDITDWLAHLKRCDQQREDINESLTQKFSGVPDELSGSNETTPDELEGFLSGRMGNVDQIFDEVATDFQNLRNRFLSKPPPKSCQAIARDYDAVLRDITAMCRDISEAMHNLDLDKLMAMSGSSYQRIDRNMAATNRDIQRLCDQYAVPNKYKLFVDKPGNPFSSAIGVGGADMKKLQEQYKDLLDGDGGGN